MAKYAIVEYDAKSANKFDSYIYDGDWDEVVMWVRENYTNVARPDMVPDVKLLEPFVGWDSEDSEFGPYEILIIPIHEFTKPEIVFWI